MCGIWVSINFDNISEKHLSCISHRGPDSTKLLEVDGKIFFGFNRLSIIDLSNRSDQPMISSDKRYFIVFNGEIYNYKELRIELEKLGHKFKTEGDTEVLLKSFVHWGEECLHRLNGMFAFLVYDRVKREIFAARDRFGIKPLYFYQEGEKIAFASEIKQFVELRSFKKCINQNRALDFIAWRLFNHTNETMWRNVYQLRGGEKVIVNLDETDIEVKDNIFQWYNYKKLKNLPTQDISINDAALEFRNLFEKSARLRLRADVDIATALSGGIDSSSLCCVIDSISEKGQTTFSLRSRHPQYDEFEYAREIVNCIKTSADNEIYLEPTDIFTNIEELVWYTDEPFASTSIVAQSKLFSSISHKNFKVALNGQGADEVLGDYGEIRPFLNELVLRKKYINVIREMESRGQWPSLALHRYYKVFKYFISLLLSHSRSRCLAGNHPIDVYTSDFDCLRENPHNYLPQNLGLDVTHNFRDYNILLLMYTHLPMLLQYDDRTSMRYSVESRVPYLDYELVEFVLSLPPEMKIRNGLTKFILRESVRDILPAKIYHRKTKLGYGTAQSQWSIQSHRGDFEQRVISAAGAIPFLDNTKVKSKLHNIDSSLTSSLFWRIIIFDIWARKFSINVN